MKYICPVCGYNELKYPPKNFSICACCGTEFDYTDHTKTHEQLRERWVSEGCKWWSKYTKAPINWNSEKQLKIFLDK